MTQLAFEFLARTPGSFLIVRQVEEGGQAAWRVQAGRAGYVAGATSQSRDKALFVALSGVDFRPTATQDCACAEGISCPYHVWCTFEDQAAAA